jgi:type III secretory pathway component EscR
MDNMTDSITNNGTNNDTNNDMKTKQYREQILNSLKKMHDVKKKKAKTYKDYLAEARERETDFAYRRHISRNHREKKRVLKKDLTRDLTRDLTKDLTNKK